MVFWFAKQNKDLTAPAFLPAHLHQNSCTCIPTIGTRGEYHAFYELSNRYSLGAKLGDVSLNIKTHVVTLSTSRSIGSVL
jgi:hypothetical protein